MRNSGVLDALPDFRLVEVLVSLRLVFEFYSVLDNVSGLEGGKNGFRFALATCWFGVVGVVGVGVFGGEWVRWDKHLGEVGKCIGGWDPMRAKL